MAHFYLVWVVLVRFELHWLVLVCFGSFWVDLGQLCSPFESFWIAFGCFALFLVVLDRFGLFWLVLGCFCSFWVVSLFSISIGLYQFKIKGIRKRK